MGIEKLNKIDRARHLLPGPGPEVVGELLQEIKDLMSMLQRQHEHLNNVMMGLDWVGESPIRCEDCGARIRYNRYKADGDRDPLCCYACHVKSRLEYLRGEIEAERISYGEIAELQSLSDYIEPEDVQLLQWAGVPESGGE